MSKIWVYTVTYNEEHFVKHFLTAYKDAEKIFVWDNMSTDRTREFLSQDPRVEIFDNDTGGTIDDARYLQIKNDKTGIDDLYMSWKKARGHADWVIVVDFDEILCNALYDGRDVMFNLDFSYAEKLGFDIIKPYGYNMIKTDAPLGLDGHPFEISQRGTRHEPNDKMCCFRPDRIEEINFSPGCHQAEPFARGFDTEDIKICHLKQYKMLHYKWWNLEHYMERMADYQTRMSEQNKKMGWAWHYLESLEFLRNQFINGEKISQFLFAIDDNVADFEIFTGNIIT